MSTESDIAELWLQLQRRDLRGIIAVTNGPTKSDADITGCVESALNELARLRWICEMSKVRTAQALEMKDKLISLLKHAENWALHVRGNLHSTENIKAITEHIEEIKSAIRILKESDMRLVSFSAEAQGIVVSERHEWENGHLIHAMHDLSKELIRATGELRSALLALTQPDLRLTGVEMKVSELTGTVNEIKTTSLKVLAEIRARIDVADARIVILETQLADADVPEAAVTALAELKAVHKQMDDIVPDAPELPPVTPPVVTPPTVP